MASQRLSVFSFLEKEMNIFLSVAVIIILPAGGLFSSAVLSVFFSLCFWTLSCSEQSSVGLLVRVAGQSLGITAVCSVLCSVKVRSKPIVKRQTQVSVSPRPFCSPENGSAPGLRGPHTWCESCCCPAPAFTGSCLGPLESTAQPCLIAPDHMAPHLLSCGSFLPQAQSVHEQNKAENVPASQQSPSKITPSCL